MLTSYKAGPTPEVRAASASLIMRHLHSKPELQTELGVQKIVKAVISAIIEDLSRFNTGFGLVAYTLMALHE